MVPTPEQSAASKPPASADFNAIYNRISLASAKQTKFLSSMRAKYPSLTRPPASADTSIPAANANGTFSSLTKPTTSFTSCTTMSSTRSRGTVDDSGLRFENPNTGLGYTAPRSEEKAFAATRDLGRRLLGKRGREADNNAATQKRRTQEEESEEEEGRSGIGRKKKKRVRADEEDSLEVEREDISLPASENQKGGDALANIRGSKPGAAPVREEQLVHRAAEEDAAATPSEVRIGTDEPKKKKQKSRKTKKATSGAGV